MNVTFGLVAQMVFALGAVIAMIYGLSWIMKRLTQTTRGEASALKLLGGVSVGARERVVLIELDNQRVLVGVAPGHVSPICVLGSAPGESALRLVAESSAGSRS